MRAQAQHHGGMSAQDHSPTEHYRLLANLARTGRVEQVRTAAPAACRVRTGDLLTTWVPWLALAAGGQAGARHWRAPQVGEQVLLIAPGGDLAQAVALVGLYSTDMPQGAQDAAVERHDYSATDHWQHSRSSAALTVDIAGSITLTVGATSVHLTPSGATITASQCTIDAPQTIITGNVVIGGTLGVAGGGAGSGTSSIAGSFAITGAQLTHNGANIGSSHTHPGVHGQTGGPQ